MINLIYRTNENEEGKLAILDCVVDTLVSEGIIKPDEETNTYNVYISNKAEFMYNLSILSDMLIKDVGIFKLRREMHDWMHDVMPLGLGHFVNFAPRMALEEALLFLTTGKPFEYMADNNFCKAVVSGTEVYVRINPNSYNRL